MSYGILTTTAQGDSMVILGDLNPVGINSQPYPTPEKAWEEHTFQLALLPASVSTEGWTSQLVELVPVGEVVPL